MNKIIFYTAAALCGIAMITSCTKENVTGLSDNALEIFAEGSGSKTTVNGNSVKWVEGDEMWVNGEQGRVTKSGNHWYVDGNFNTTSEFNSFYPASIASSSDASNLLASTPTVVFPSHYACSFDANGAQVISLPMTARSAAGANGIQFRHLSAGVNVVVTNTTGDKLSIDSVCVSSNSVNLSGQASVSLGVNVDPSNITAGNGYKTVTVSFASLTLDNDASKTIQVPVIPNANGLGALTVSVYSHIVLDNSSILFITYTNTKNAGTALARNTVASLPVNMKTEGDQISRHILGAFTVGMKADGVTPKKVYFSMGNLQYNINETYPWRFAANQYDYVGSWNTSTWVDLFGWGTWTGDNPNPLNTSKKDADYSWNNGDFKKENFLADPSQRDFDWRTLSKDEFVFLLNYDGKLGRTDSYRFVKAIVHNVNGLIIFPDDFTMPTGVTIIWKNQRKKDYSDNTLSNADWTALESEGCIFLPAAGNREVGNVQEVNVMGGYHSSTPNGTSGYDFKLRFADSANATTNSNNNDVDPARKGGQRWGNSVRLVRDAN